MLYIILEKKLREVKSLGVANVTLTKQAYLLKHIQYMQEIRIVEIISIIFVLAFVIAIFVYTISKR